MSTSHRDPERTMVGTRAADVDPWSDFLSESSDELQGLQELLGSQPEPSNHPPDLPPAGGAVILSLGHAAEGSDVSPGESASPSTGALNGSDVTPSTPVTSSAAADVPPAQAHVDGGPTSEVFDPVAPDRPSFGGTSVWDVTRHSTPDPWSPTSPVVQGARVDSRPSASGSTGFSQPDFEWPAAPHPDSTLVALPAFERGSPSPELVPSGTDRSSPASSARAPDVPALPVPRPSLSPDAARAAGATGITMAEVLNRQVPVRWPEAVAAIEELCDVLVRRGGAKVLVPEPRHVMITSAGTVVVLPGGRGDEDVRAVGRMLHALLATATVPLPLRLFVTSSVASRRYQSVELYGDALSHYSVGDRAESIKALCLRAVQAVEVSRSGRARAPVVEVDARGASVARRRARRAAWSAVTVVAAVAGAAAAGAYWYAFGPQAAPGLQRADTAVAPEGGADGSRADSAGRAADANPWALGGVDVPAPSPRASAAGVSALGRSGVRREPPAEPLGASPLPSVPASPVAPVLRAPRTAPVARAPEPAPPSAPPSVAALPPVNLSVYSAADMDVEPPVALSSQPLLPPLTPNSDARRASTFELVIDEQGIVLSARLRDRPQTLADGLPISYLKMQKFRPATKDGVPVRYRLLLEP